MRFSNVQCKVVMLSVTTHSYLREREVGDDHFNRIQNRHNSETTHRHNVKCSTQCTPPHTPEPPLKDHLGKGPLQ